jgi:hypothetical protein
LSRCWKIEARSAAKAASLSCFKAEIEAAAVRGLADNPAAAKRTP